MQDKCSEHEEGKGLQGYERSSGSKYLKHIMTKFMDIELTTYIRFEFNKLFLE
jgi:hypothetical protein